MWVCTRSSDKKAFAGSFGSLFRLCIKPPKSSAIHLHAEIFSRGGTGVLAFLEANQRRCRTAIGTLSFYRVDVLFVSYLLIDVDFFVKRNLQLFIEQWISLRVPYL